MKMKEIRPGKKGRHRGAPSASPGNRQYHYEHDYFIPNYAVTQADPGSFRCERCSA